MSINSLFVRKIHKYLHRKPSTRVSEKPKFPQVKVHSSSTNSKNVFTRVQNTSYIITKHQLHYYKTLVLLLFLKCLPIRCLYRLSRRTYFTWDSVISVPFLFIFSWTLLILIPNFIQHFLFIMVFKVNYLVLILNFNIFLRRYSFFNAFSVFQFWIIHFATTYTLDNYNFLREIAP